MCTASLVNDQSPGPLAHEWTLNAFHFSSGSVLMLTWSGLLRFCVLHHTYRCTIKDVGLRTRY